MMTTQTQLQPGQIWRCWNGDLYMIDCTTLQSAKSYREISAQEASKEYGGKFYLPHKAAHTESENEFIFWKKDGQWWHEPQHGVEPHAVYASLDGSKIWARPLPMFLSDRNGQPRFVLQEITNPDA